jgi:hypothetical protein
MNINKVFFSFFYKERYQLITLLVFVGYEYVGFKFQNMMNLHKDYVYQNFNYVAFKKFFKSTT